ncbi:hypothetical protein PSMA108079_00740 [Pseudoalteromonas mariniglutinosa]
MFINSEEVETASLFSLYNLNVGYVACYFCVQLMFKIICVVVGLAVRPQ